MIRIGERKDFEDIFSKSRFSTNSNNASFTVLEVISAIQDSAVQALFPNKMIFAYYCTYQKFMDIDHLRLSRANPYYIPLNYTTYSFLNRFILLF